MKKHLVFKSKALFFLFSLLLFGQFLKAQIYPVTVNTRLVPPYSIFLYDYIAERSNKLSVNVVFNDLNETDRDVYFKIRIENSDVAIYTKPDFVPVEPFNIASGTMLEFSGEDFEDYLNFNNLVFSGIDRARFIQNGSRIPPGLYTFTVEVYDFKSRKKISNQGSAVAYLQLNKPPVVIFPRKGDVVPVSENQSIGFQWQPTIIHSNGSLNETEYKISVYEIFASCKNPEYAVANKQANKIFESDYKPETSFMYDLSYPQLETGKRYAVVVNAIDINGRDIFENKGNSEQSWFNYGYPENGYIQLKYPLNNTSFTLQEQQFFNWEAPDNLIPGQGMYYKFKIVATEGLSAENAIKQNQAFYEKTTSFRMDRSGGQVTADSYLERKTEYAWQVTAYTDDQQIAQSDIFICNGAPLVSEIWANKHLIKVTKTNNKDFNNLSGEGKLRVSRDGATIDIKFKNIKVVNENGEWKLKKGSIIQAIENSEPIPVVPSNTENENAYMSTDSVRLTKIGGKYRLQIKASIEYVLPHGVDSTEIGIIRTENDWMSFDDYVPKGRFQLKKHNNFDLLEPFNHRLLLDTKSYFRVSDNKYTMKFYGSMLLPDDIKKEDGKRISVSFHDIDNLSYFTNEGAKTKPTIKPIKNTEIVIKPSVVIFDFSDKTSPVYFSGKNEWKGVFFEQFSVAYKTDVDLNNQIALKQDISSNHVLTKGSKSKAWTTGEGYTFYIPEDFSGKEAVCNTFPSILKGVLINIEKSTVKKSYFKGTIKIPIIDEKEDYSYFTPITENGFSTPYLEKNFRNFKYTLNPQGGEQKINITIKTISFVDKNKLDMTIDVGWPSIKAELKAIDGFCIWGNYAIGFFTPNGARDLVHRVDGKIDQFQLTVKTIGAGSSEGAYGFGLSGVVNIGDDIAGEKGPPEVNLYSVYASKYAPFVDMADFQFTENSSVTNSIENIEAELAELEKVDEKINNLDGEQERLTEMLKAGVKADSTHIGETYSPDDFKNIIEEVKKLSADDLIEILNNIKILLPPDKQVKIQQVVDVVDKEVPEDLLREIVDFFNDPSEFAKKAAKDAVNKQINKINTKIDSKVNSVNKRITETINIQVNKATGMVNSTVDSLFSLVETSVIGIVKNEQFDVEPIVKEAVKISSDALKEEINTAIINSINTNITKPLTEFTKVKIGNTVTTFIRKEIEGLAYGIIDEGNPDLDFDLSGLTDSIADNIIGGLDPEKLLNTAKKAGTEVIDNISFEGYVERILKEAKEELLEPSKALSKGAEMLVQNLSKNVPALSGIVSGVDFDFDNVGEKLKNGQIDQIIKLDKIAINIDTKTLKLSGFAEYKKDDPDWGNCFRAKLDAIIKLKKGMTIGAGIEFINGKTTQEPENFSYWFVEAHVELSEGIPLTPNMQIYGFGGNIYKNISRGIGGQGDFSPDSKLKFGASVSMKLNDILTTGKNIDLLVTAELEFLEDGFTAEIRGEVSIANTETGPIVYGEGYINFSTISNCFKGEFEVTIEKKPVICAGGKMGFEITKNSWNIYIGKKKEPIFLRFLCRESLELDAWFDISNTMLDMGLIGNFSIGGSTGWIGKDKFGFSCSMEAELNIETSALIYWKPFQVAEATIAVSTSFEIYCKYNFIGISGQIYVGAGLSGSLILTSTPVSKIKGELAGYVETQRFKKSFKMNIEKSF